MNRTTVLRRRYFQGKLAAELANGHRAEFTLYWLGQAGFLIITPKLRILIDPYLSNSLALKYASLAFSHDRLMVAPIVADELGHIDLVLCTHHHTDHLDGETLTLLAKRLPSLRFVVPKASIAIAQDRINVGIERLIGVDAGERIAPLPGLNIAVARAAHEKLERDSSGYHRFLGFGLSIDCHRVFHSGDTIPFAGQESEIKNFAPHIALLPVNGRSDRLRNAGFAGNMNLEEAIDLTTTCGISATIAHHYGMFAFNTTNPKDIDLAILSAPFQLLRAEVQIAYESVLYLKDEQL